MVAVEVWTAAHHRLAPRGATAIRLCRYSSLNAHPSLALVSSRLLKRPALVEQLVSEFDRLPSPHGAVHCPADDESQILARLDYPDGREVMISVGLTGCEAVTNGSVQRTAAGMGSPRAFGPKLVKQLDRLIGVRSSETTVGGIVCDQAVAYRSLSALRRAASSVAVLAPTTSTRRTSLGGLPITITRVRVQETLAGKRLARTILLRQTGAPGTALTGCGQLVAAGRRYLAYLTPFRLHHGDQPVSGQYTVVGASQGLFELHHPTSTAGSSTPAALPTRPTVESAPWHLTHVSGRHLTVHWSASGTCNPSVAQKPRIDTVETNRSVTITVRVDVVKAGGALRRTRAGSLHATAGALGVPARFQRQGGHHAVRGSRPHLHQLLLHRTGSRPLHAEDDR
jgi:hypothetical protein